MIRKNIYEEAYLNNIIHQQSRFEELKKQFTPEQYSIQKVIELLNIAIIDEQLAELNYLASYNLCKTQGKADVDPEFKAHEDEQRAHKHDLIARLRELDSKVPTIAISEWYHLNSQGNNWKQETLEDTFEILKNRIKQEQDAIEFYTLCVAFTRGQDDTTTYTLFKKIKEDEQKHLLDLSDLAREYGLIEQINNPVRKTTNIQPEQPTSIEPIVADEDQI